MMLSDDNGSHPDDGSFFAVHPDRDCRLHTASSADVHRAGLAVLPEPGSTYLRFALRTARSHVALIRLVPTDDIVQLNGRSTAELLAFFTEPFLAEQRR
jgi:hypothetical protein